MLRVSYTPVCLSAAGELAEFKNKAEGIHTISNACGEAFENLKLRRKHKFIIFKVGDWLSKELFASILMKIQFLSKILIIYSDWGL